MPIRNKEKLDALAAKLAKVPTSTPEYKNWIQRLDKAAQNGNLEAKYTLDKTVKYATADREGYDGLQEFAMEDYRNIIDHELYHLIEKNRWTEHYIPKINLLDFMIDDNDLVRMLIDNNGDELAARVVQVKNHNKVSDGKRTFSGDEYKKMFEKYIEDGAVDNNIFDTYESISDWDKFAKWANRIIPFSILGIKKKDNAE